MLYLVYMFNAHMFFSKSKKINFSPEDAWRVAMRKLGQNHIVRKNFNFLENIYLYIFKLHSAIYFLKAISPENFCFKACHLWYQLTSFHYTTFNDFIKIFTIL